MKFGIFVCVLVVLGCYEALCSGPLLLLGNCTLDDLPSDIRNSCRTLFCTKDHLGEMVWESELCGWTDCGSGRTTEEGPTDLSKTYPGCCPQYSCHDI